jgi:molybdopterin converting factor small subunit
VYLNEKVLAVHSLYYSPLKEELLKKVEDLKNGKNVCEFIEEIYEGLNIQKIRKENRKRKSDYVPIMRFEFEGDDLNEQLKEELYKLPLVEINSNSNCYKVVWKTPLNFYVIQYNSNADKQSSIATLKESFDMVKKFLIGIKDKDNGAGYIEHKRDVIEKIAKKYIEQALKLFFNNIRWEWDHTSFLRSYFNFPDAVMGFTDDVYGFYKENIISKFNKKHNEKSEVSEFYREKMRSIGKELEAKLEVVEKLKEGEESIKGKPDILCIAISNLIAYPIKQKRSIEQNITTSNSSVDPQEQNKYTGPIMEIDGLILGLTTEKQLFICLIEAKSGNEGATRAVRSKIRDHENDIFRGYDISNLINLVRGLNYNSTAYLIITDEKIPTFPNP